MTNRIAKYAVMAFIALGMSVMIQAGHVLGQGMPGPHPGEIGPGSFAFERIVGAFAGKVVTNAPFSAQVNRETIQVLSDGTRVDQKATDSIARDSVGRTRQEITLPAIGPLAASGQVPHLAFIRDPAAGKNYTIYIMNEDKKTVIAFSHPAGANEPGRRMMKQRMNAGENPNVQTVSLGTKTINGLTVQGTRRIRTIPVGRIGNDKPIVITREEWYSPDLQMVISSTRSDPRFGTTTYQLTNINRAEPPQSLFIVPPDYTVTPGGMMKRRFVKPAPSSPPDAF
ncbi:MAG TPA: hypothetical protein VGR84_07385 [Candidatus Acidoferrales bacterium]|nr:hypothetical protein [Candidatus Acidoferrales bacterium]